MLKTVSNIAKIPELRKKMLITAGILALVRIGVYVPIPGVNVAKISELIKRSAGGGMLGSLGVLADLFAGGGLERASLFALGVMPYITSSIVFQVLIAVIPALEKIAKEGESGRRRINQYTRYATVLICFVQGGAYAKWVHHVGYALPTMGGFSFVAVAVLTMAAGSLLCMWLGEQIDEFGIGNGISIIIMINIVSRLPVAIANLGKSFSWKLGASEEGLIDPARLVTLVGLFVFMVLAVVAITQAQRRIPITHSRSGGGFTQTSYLPLRVNMAGVISIIFAQAVMMVPPILERLNVPYFSNLMTRFTPWKFWYVALYMGFIIFFTYFYTAVVFNPLEHAHQLKQYGAFIQGVRPGRQTAEYLHWIMNRITLPGAIFLAVIAVFPQVVSSTMGVDFLIASFFGGTGLLIVVGVALDVVQRIENYLLMQYYEGFLGRGGSRIRGRRY